MEINKRLIGVIMIYLGLLVGSLGVESLLSQQALSVKAAPPVQEQSDGADPAEELEEEQAEEIDDLMVDESSFALDRIGARFCSTTALAQARACSDEVQDDFFSTIAICLNTSSPEEQAECLAEAKDTRQEERQNCREQRRARLDLCQAIGEAPYDPSFDPADFDSDFTNLTTPNPYRPFGIGHRWEYIGGDETVTVEVFNETKLVEGVTCIVVNDVVTINGELVEDTDDWFAHAKNGDIYYCGEEVKDFETFAGDNPSIPELISIDGSFKAGREGDKPGILTPGTPMVGQVYRQEWSPGNAEDAVEVLSTTYSFGSDPELDQFVPQALAELLCAANDCLVTRDFTPIEPDALERKYYAPGVGAFLEIDMESGDTVQLVGCNFDPRCESLPAP